MALVRQTCEEMLRDRGCERVRQHPSQESSASGRVLLVSGERPAIDVYLCTEDRVGVRVGRGLIEANRGQNRRLVMVSLDGPTVMTRKECEGEIQFLLAKDLCYNVMRHALVPTHTVVTEEELPCPPHQLPKLLDTDPVARYHDWPVGTLVRVDRVFGGNECVPFYRCVVKAG